MSTGVFYMSRFFKVVFVLTSDILVDDYLKSITLFQMKMYCIQRNDIQKAIRQQMLIYSLVFCSS